VADTPVKLAIIQVAYCWGVAGTGKTRGTSCSGPGAIWSVSPHCGFQIKVAVGSRELSERDPT
jgi:hypothetical protein